MKCIVDQTGVTEENKDEAAPDTSYYQWVTFMFALQAAFFYLPYKEQCYYLISLSFYSVNIRRRRKEILFHRENIGL